MRLSAFIQDTLYEIALGVQLARARSRELVAITPATIDGLAVSEKTYVDFDVAIVVNSKEKSKRGGKGKLSAEIEVASVFKAGIGGGGEASKDSTTATEHTHRVAFKVPVYMNANFRNNAAAAEDAEELLAAHGLK